MPKKVIAGCLSFLILSGLAYYSSYLYSSEHFQEYNLQLEEELEKRRQKYNFETGIKETIQWYMDNQEWMDNVTSGDYLKYYEKMYGDR